MYIMSLLFALKKTEAINVKVLFPVVLFRGYLLIDEGTVAAYNLLLVFFKKITFINKHIFYIIQSFFFIFS